MAKKYRVTLTAEERIELEAMISQGRADTRKRVDWARFIRELVDGRYQDAERVVLVIDQLDTHSTSSLYEASLPGEARRLVKRLEVHPTPKHGSWLNMAEIELSVLSRDLPERVGGRAAMARHLGGWKRRRNQTRTA